MVSGWLYRGSSVGYFVQRTAFDLVGDFAAEAGSCVLGHDGVALLMYFKICYAVSVQSA